MNKQHLLPISLVPLAVFSCLASSETEPKPGTGLEGVISISPIHGGPARVGIPNSRPLANTVFLVKQGDRTVTTFKTDDQGAFRISLASGHYAISMKDRKGAIGKYGPFEVDVVAGQIKKVQWTCDTGMR
jgi:hypothetical protein